MDLKIKDVADLLSVAEKTIKEWVNTGKIPCYRINQQIRFSRTEIENWVILHKIERNTLKSNITEPTHGRGNKRFSLFRAIHKGEVLHHVQGSSKEEIIKNTMQMVAKSLHLDADVMTELLLDRESLMPTALNNGIAVPHTRDSLLHSPHDIVVTVFLENPLPYGALDGKPVHTLFFLFACEDKRHLHLLAKIAHLSSQEETVDFLQSRPGKTKLLEFVKKWEARIAES